MDAWGNCNLCTADIVFLSKSTILEKLSVTVQVKWTQIGKNLFLLSSSRMWTMLAHMNRINKDEVAANWSSSRQVRRGRWQVDSTRLRLWIFLMQCRSLVAHTRDLVYMPTLIASCSQCDAAIAAAVHCNTWLISSVSAPMQHLDGWGGSSLCRIHLIPPPPHG